MALVIGELIIRAEIEAPSQSGGGAAAPGGAGDDEKQALIQACVDEVMQILADKEAP